MPSSQLSISVLPPSNVNVTSSMTLNENALSMLPPSNMNVLSSFKANEFETTTIRVVPPAEVVRTSSVPGLVLLSNLPAGQASVFSEDQLNHVHATSGVEAPLVGVRNDSHLQRGGPLRHSVSNRTLNEVTREASMPSSIPWLCAETPHHVVQRSVSPLLRPSYSVGGAVNQADTQQIGGGALTGLSVAGMPGASSPSLSQLCGKEFGPLPLGHYGPRPLPVPLPLPQHQQQARFT